jgi:hypothetical protein
VDKNKFGETHDGRRLQPIYILFPHLFVGRGSHQAVIVFRREIAVHPTRPTKEKGDRNACHPSHFQLWLLAKRLIPLR